MATNRGQ